MSANETPMPQQRTVKIDFATLMGLRGYQDRGTAQRLLAEGARLGANIGKESLGYAAITHG